MDENEKEKLDPPISRSFAHKPPLAKPNLASKEKTPKD
jgi:hypothetical protein